MVKVRCFRSCLGPVLALGPLGFAGSYKTAESWEDADLDSWAAAVAKTLNSDLHCSAFAVRGECVFKFSVR